MGLMYIHLIGICRIFLLFIWNFKFYLRLASIFLNQIRCVLLDLDESEKLLLTSNKLKWKLITWLGSKVRDIYDGGDYLVLVTTDRQSAFDRILASIPFKGQVISPPSLLMCIWATCLIGQKSLFIRYHNEF